MSPKYVSIVLIFATVIFSASCHPGAAKEETTPVSAWQQFKVFSARAITGLRNMAVVLTVPKLKDRQDICVWKICSRPLKRTNKIPEVKLSEAGHKLSDADLVAIWKKINPRIVSV